MYLTKLVLNIQHVYVKPTVWFRMLTSCVLYYEFYVNINQSMPSSFQIYNGKTTQKVKKYLAKPNSWTPCLHHLYHNLHHWCLNQGTLHSEGMSGQPRVRPWALHQPYKQWRVTEGSTGVCYWGAGKITWIPCCHSPTQSQLNLAQAGSVKVTG